MKLTALFAAVLLAVGCTADGPVKENLPADSQLRIGVKYRPDECPRKAMNGNRVSVHYTGTLYTTGEKFDSSLDRGTPFDFTLGQGMVIKGWDQGLLGACVGEKRKLTIPSGKGYGDRGAGGKIPPGATLVFDIEVMAIQ